MSEKFVVTITREFGSMGRPIARLMSEMLDIEYYDRDIVDETAKSLNLPVSVVSNEEEAAKSFLNMKYPLGRGTSEIQDNIFNAQQKVMNELVEKHSCIIVGRCSDYLFQNHKNSLHIYIYAPYEKRLENCVSSLFLKPEEAKKTISEVDKARTYYHMHYAGYMPYDYRHKDLMVDSSILGINGTAEYLAEMIRRRFYPENEKS